MSSNLTPYDTGETLEPNVWTSRHIGDRTDFGKVDFDSPEGGTEFTIQIVKNDPVPAGGEEFTIRITPLAAASYIVQEERE